MKIFYYTSHEITVEESFVYFFKIINSAYTISTESIRLYFYIPNDVSKASQDDLFELLKERNIGISPDSAELALINNIYSQSIVLFKSRSPFPHIQSTDIIIAPFFEISDYHFLKGLENSTRNNVVCLTNQSIETLASVCDSNDQIVELNNVIGDLS